MRRGGKASASSSEEVEELQAGNQGGTASNGELQASKQAIENCKQVIKRELQANKGTASK